MTKATLATALAELRRECADKEARRARLLAEHEALEKEADARYAEANKVGMEVYALRQAISTLEARAK